MAAEVEDARARDAEFEQQVVAHMDVMYAAAMNLTRNAADAKDLLQDALVRALRFHYRYRRGTYLKAWLLTILRNTFINNYRRKARRPLEVELKDAEFAWETGADRDMTFVPKSSRAEDLLEFLGDETRMAIDALPDTHRRTVIMADLQDMSYREIAAELDCPLGTVMSRLHRGRRLLRETLPPEMSRVAAAG
jgi:RNA polymerase sigma-70 factor (ECF subfamily)